MPAIRFLKDVAIGGASGPAGHESRTSFLAGEVLIVREDSAAHFVKRQQAVEVPLPASPSPRAAAPIDTNDDGPEPADLPETDGEADIAAEPAPRRRGRPRKTEE